MTEGITTDSHEFIRAINRVLPYYEPCDPFSGSRPAEHDFLRNMDEEKAKFWVKPSQMYPDDDIYDQFESQYLYLTLKSKSILVTNNGSMLISKGKTDVFDLLFRTSIGFAKEDSPPIGAYLSSGCIINLVYADDSDEVKELLDQYLKEHPIDTPQDQLSRQIDF